MPLPTIQSFEIPGLPKFTNTAGFAKRSLVITEITLQTPLITKLHNCFKNCVNDKKVCVGYFQNAKKVFYLLRKVFLVRRHSK